MPLLAWPEDYDFEAVAQAESDAQSVTETEAELQESLEEEQQPEVPDSPFQIEAAENTPDSTQQEDGSNPILLQPESLSSEQPASADFPTDFANRFPSSFVPDSGAAPMAEPFSWPSAPPALGELPVLALGGETLTGKAALPENPSQPAAGERSEPQDTAEEEAKSQKATSEQQTPPEEDADEQSNQQDEQDQDEQEEPDADEQDDQDEQDLDNQQPDEQAGQDEQDSEEQQPEDQGEQEPQDEQDLEAQAPEDQEDQDEQQNQEDQSQDNQDQQSDKQDQNDQDNQQESDTSPDEQADTTDPSDADSQQSNEQLPPSDAEQEQSEEPSNPPDSQNSEQTSEPATPATGDGTGASPSGLPAAAATIGPANSTNRAAPFNLEVSETQILKPTDPNQPTLSTDPSLPLNASTPFNTEAATQATQDWTKPETEQNQNPLGSVFGTINQFEQGALYGYLTSADPNWSQILSRNDQGTGAYQFGEVLGDIAASVQGISEMAFGGGLGGGGAAIAFGGSETVVAIPAGAALAAEGAGIFKNGWDIYNQAKQNLEEDLQKPQVYEARVRNESYVRPGAVPGPDGKYQNEDVYDPQTRQLAKDNNMPFDEASVLKETLDSPSVPPDGKKYIGEAEIARVFGRRRNEMPAPEFMVERNDGKFIAAEVKNQKTPDIGHILQKFEAVAQSIKDGEGLKKNAIGEFDIYVRKGYSSFSDRSYSVDANGQLMRANASGKLEPVVIDGVPVRVKERDFVPQEQVHWNPHK